MPAAVIMAGGKGERFWPRSRTRLPKQFLSLVGEETMIQMTVNRLLNIIDLKDIYIVTNELYCDIIADQLRDLPRENVIVEPTAKNTAPCVALAAQYLYKRGVRDSVAFLPSDHYFGSEVEFVTTLESAFATAQQHNTIVTLGIRAVSPETGYGYIQRGSIMDRSLKLYQVEKFVEKPDRPTAEQYLRDGRFSWNSGMYVATQEALKMSFLEHAPELWDTLAPAVELEDEQMIIEAYESLPSVSIDYAIAEKEERLLVMETDLSWNDLGSWTSLADVREQDEFGNVVSGTELVAIDASGCVVDSVQKGLVALIGVDDLVVVLDQDVLLVCAKDRAQDIKTVITELRHRKREVYL